MSEVQKISIRFFDDREVRAVGDEAGAKWWFSLLDIIGVLNAQNDYAKNRNYWKYLKTKLRNEGNEVVSGTSQLKMLAPDGKRRFTGCRKEFEKYRVFSIDYSTDFDFNGDNLIPLGLEWERDDKYSMDLKQFLSEQLDLGKYELLDLNSRE